MADAHVEEHSSLITTPRQLIVVVVLSFVIPVIGLIMIASFASGGLKMDSKASDASEAAVARRLKPVGDVAFGDIAAPAATGQPTAAGVQSPGGPVKTAAVGPGAGKKLYDTVCMACHAAGIAGAPKTGDKAAWKPRIAAGKQALYNSALHGKNAMPAKGGMASAADGDVKAAVDFMLSQTK